MILLGTGYSTDIPLIILFLFISLLVILIFNYKFIRFFLFLFNAEFIHKFSFNFIKVFMYFPFNRWALRKIYFVQHNKLNREIFGLKFSNPVGLAAGFDKDAKLFNELEPFGFSFIEIGTVTPLPQDGNPKPRLFRLKDDSGLINRMGFNNDGLEVIVSRLRRKKASIIIGGNIGKNKKTSNIEAINDYRICFEKLFPFVDYFVVNVSSPNTPGLRDLQQKEPLTSLLNSLQVLNNRKDKRKPILLKISPDLNNQQLDDIIQIISITNIDGVIATNTTIGRGGLKTDEREINAIGDGGLSGVPIKNKSTEIIKYLSNKSKKAFPIIGVGGIHSVEDAIEKLEAGADLVQIYTGFIYEGPMLVKRINKAILNR
ncbi:MAG: quinone-dependent dihydroorotate dehydrogenase [Bacteroidota bacterium]|nr:quinone-dependent dihydroorotate dehydrogenase [Bacteroidota bacterium]